MGRAVSVPSSKPLPLEQNTMSTLTRRGARNLTATLDRIASAIQENPSLLGIEDKIAADFAYRCDLISDAIETQAVSNFPKAAADFAADEIGEEEPGPLVQVDSDEPWMKGHFTQEDFHQLGQIAEKLASAAQVLSAPVSEKTASEINDHGFDLTK
jgi:hypothetical protein